MSLRAAFLREMATLDLQPAPSSASPVSDDDIAGLPHPAQRYLRRMNVVGRPRDWSFRLQFKGRFRAAQRLPWMPCEAWQYNSSLPVARVMHMGLRVAGAPVIVGRDSYVDGNGRMLIKAIERLTIGDSKGEEMDIAELVTYLDDAVLMAPSMLLVPQVAWSPIDDSTFDVSLSDRGRTVTGRVTIDTSGAPVNFTTTDRFVADPGQPKRLVRGRWSTPIDGWITVAERPLPGRVRAIWHLDKGDFPYADVRPVPDSVAFNIPPGQ